LTLGIHFCNPGNVFNETVSLLDIRQSLVAMILEANTAL